MSASLTVDRDVIVVGGGPAGLAAAWHASRRGFRVTVLERSSSLGGMAASVLVDEVRADLGSHRLHPATPGDVMADLQELLGGSLQVRNRNGRVRVAGRWVGFPLSPANLLRTMPLSWAARVSADALLARRRRSPNPDSYAAALRASLGPTVYDSLYGPYARKLWGVPGEQIDPEQARVRVAADTAARVAARMIRRGISSRRQGSPQRGTHFLYPAGGFGEIPRALAEAARSLEATVHTGAAVTRIDTGPDSTTTRVDPAPGSPASTTSPGTGRPLVQVHTADGRTWQAPTVCSTLPLSVLAGVINPAPPQPVCQQAQSLVTRGMVLVSTCQVPTLRCPASASPPTTGTAMTTRRIAASCAPRFPAPQETTCGPPPNNSCATSCSRRCAATICRRLR
ncbi:MAG: hypothetical protein CSB46_06575 [Micrococcales bacterium]|nr:MAG: hypothetical protein CSB46_06575 [Micrococcales bacterium]